MTGSRRLTLTFAAILATAALAVVVLHGTQAGQDAMMRSFHLRPAQPAEFVAVQLLPTMYVAQNRVWVSDGPVDWAEIEENEADAIFLPHYPAKLVTSGPREMLRTPCPLYVGIESRLRGRRWRTNLRIDAAADGIRLQPTDVPPTPECLS